LDKIYRARPTSRLKIRSFANQIRKIVGLEKSTDFPILAVFEFLSAQGIFTFEILPKEDMENKCGETFPEERHILIREDIYEEAYKEMPFARTTLAHELYHLFFHGGEAISLCRTDSEIKARRAYEDPEWQANCFAGELLVPKDLVVGMSVEEVMKNCNVSVTMAKTQLEHYSRG